MTTIQSLLFRRVEASATDPGVHQIRASWVRDPTLTGICCIPRSIFFAGLPESIRFLLPSSISHRKLLFLFYFCEIPVEKSREFLIFELCLRPYPCRTLVQIFLVLSDGYFASTRSRKRGILRMHEVVVMGMKFETKGKKQANIHYANVPQPNVVEENFGGYYHDDDFALAVVLQNQEFQRDVHLDMARDSPRSVSRPKSAHSESRGEKNSSRNARYESQLALDEAFARELQELENQLSDSSLGENSRSETNANHRKSSTVNAEHSSAGTSSQVATEDDIDPENMSYEELQQLGEAIGTESKGLPDELIAYLQSSTYRTGLFSRKGKQEQCVICCMAYKNRDKLIILPCQHQYHGVCISKWLKINKVCPICNEEVFGS